MTEDRQTRIGVLVPAGNTVHQREFAKLRPEGVEFRFLGFAYPPRGTVNFCEALGLKLAAPIEELRQWGAELILLGCTTASMACSAESHVAELERLAGVPVVTAASASRDAIQALGLRSVAVTTPYGATNNGIVADFLSGLGVDVAALKGLDLDRSPEVWIANQPLLTPDYVLELGLSVNTDDADALYLPCTGVGSLEVIDEFEHKTGKPAVSSVQAGFWASFRRLGLDGRQSGSGQLLEVWDY